MKTTIFSIAFMILFSSPLLSQQKVITLSTQMSGNHDVVARDEVILSPGFSYTPASGSTFTARINKSLIVEAEYLQGGETPDPNGRELNTDFPVGSTKGNYSVNSNGAATYNIPIFTPPGTNGMEPVISVAYNSQGGNGLMGIGWSLSGLSAITRINKPYYVDSDINGINLDGNDSYALDGNRLVLTYDNPGGYDGDEYLPEAETFSEITSNGTSGNGPAWFDVRLKNGTIIEYGNGPNSGIKANDSTTLVWNITKITDPFGNYCEYIYKRDNSTNQRYLKKIIYTGNSNTSLEPYNELNFIYERKADANEIYFPGLTVPQKLVLTKIESISEGVILRSYIFDYTNILYPHLVELTEYGLNNVQLNSSIFKWGNKSSTYREVSIDEALDPNDNILYAGDFNGDGKADVITVPKIGYTTSDYWRLFLGTESGYELINEGNLNNQFKGFTIADGDNDGDDDIYWASLETVEYPCPPEEIMKIDTLINEESLQSKSSLMTKGDTLQNMEEVLFNEPCFVDQVTFEFLYYSDGGFIHDESYDIVCIPVTDIPEMLPADFNGDGETDFLFLDETKNVIKFSNLYVTGSPYVNSPDFISLIDFNGNGKTDIAIVDGTSLEILEYNSATHTFSNILSDYTIGTINGISTGDFNGDGKTDFLCRYDNNYIVTTKIFYSTGNDLIEKTTPVTIDLTVDDPPDPPYPKTIIYRNFLDLIVSDFNGDGKSDILKSNWIINRTYDEEHSFTTTETTIDSIFLSDGVDFILQDTAITLNDRHSFSQLDNNYDGNADLSIMVNGVVQHVVEFFPNDKRHLLVSVTDGWNLKVEFDYKLLSDQTVHTREQESVSFPVSFVTPPVRVVAGVEIYDNNDQSLLEESTYHYTNFKLHRQGKGILGFSKVISSNLTTGKKNVAQYAYVNTHYNTYLHLSNDSINGNIISVTTNSQSFKTFANDRYLPYISSSISTDNLNNTSVESSLVLDGSGNITQKETNYLDENQTVVRQTTIDFDGYNSFGLPESISTTNTRGNETISRSQSLAYNTPTGSLHSITSDYGDSPDVISVYDYDDFGNPLTITTSSDDETRTNTNIYEPVKGRFLLAKVNPLDDTVSYTYNASGSLLTMRDITHLTTSYSYDEFSNLKETTFPDGRIVDNSINWSVNSLEIGELYYSQTVSDGKPTTIEYYDILGRKIRSKTQGFNGTYLVTDAVYDQVGRLGYSYNSYFEGSSRTQYVHYDYDDLNRVITETYVPNNTSTTYDYNPLKITTTKAGQTYEKDFDASGLVTQSIDPGGNVQYVYNAEGKTIQINSPSGNTVIEYNDYGYQSSLEDIDAGTIEYVYNAFGELETQTDAKGNEQTLEYDNIGRVISKSWTGGESITYSYNALNGQIKSIVSSSGVKQRFVYDYLNRLQTRVDSINNNNKFTASYSYDNESGDLENILLNNTVSIDYGYNTYGYLNQVSTNNQTVWTATSMNKYGIVDNFTLGNQATTSITYDSYGSVSGIETTKNSTYLQNWDYEFNHTTGNLTSRTGLNTTGNSVEESFTYDDLNRLLTYTIGQNVNSLTYDDDGIGNIINKTDVGDYNYTAGVHNVETISDPTTLMSNLPEQEVEYTKFNKVSYIGDFLSSPEDRELTITYGPDEERVKTVYTIDNVVNITKYFALGQYEKEVDASDNVRELYYISAPDGVVAVLERANSQNNIYYIHNDYLGSYDVISNSDGTVRERYNYDPWGRRRNPADWSYNNISTSFFIDRGFTGHEHLDQFGLINMNGRVYDPLIAMFLNPDNNVQSPDFTQNFNRYSYCLNNPFIYTDPSGNYPAPIQESGIEFWRWSGGGGSYGSGGQYQNGLPREELGLYEAGPDIIYHDYGTVGAPCKDGNGQGIAGIYFDNLSNTFRAISTGSYVDPFTANSYILELWDFLKNTLNAGDYYIEMNRFAESPDATLSSFMAIGPEGQYVNGYFLEPGGPSTSSAGMDRRIPSGTYNMEWKYSNHFKSNMYLISNSDVSADRAIRMHIGNYYFETEGCLLPGSSYGIKNGNYYVLGSGDTYQNLMQFLNTNKTTLIINDINP